MGLGSDIVEADVVISFEVLAGKLYIYHGTFSQEQEMQERARHEANQVLRAGGRITWDDGKVEYYRTTPVLADSHYVLASDGERIQHHRVHCTEHLNNPGAVSEEPLLDVFLPIPPGCC